MLSSEYIHEQMRNASSCSTQQLGELKELMDLYPYASSIVTLYLKSLANDRDLRLSSQLEKYAYQIPNRELLYDLLVTQTSVSNHVSTSSEAVQEQKSEVESVKAEEFVSIAPIINMHVDVTSNQSNEVKEIVLEKDLEEVETLIEPEAKPEESQPEAQLVTPETNELPLEEQKIKEALEQVAERALDEVDTMIQSAVISSSYLQLAYPEDDLEMDPEQALEIEGETDEAQKDDHSIQSTNVPNTIAPKSFTDWLKIGEMSRNDLDEMISEDKKPTFYQFEKPKKEFFSPAKKAKESVDENKMPVSETLAQVFALQGNINKAIHVYEQLILIFPEKKSFFASQIRTLKRKLNS
jgi:hypothetical protein